RNEAVRHRWARVPLVATSLGLTVLLLEVALNVLRPPVAYPYRPYWPEVSHFSPSTLLPFELRKNGRVRFTMPEFDITVTTNELGLRGGPVDRTRPVILCLGDSFTFGFGVEDDQTFCAHLERLFSGRYQFLNAGFAAGYAPDMYALWLTARASELHPVGLIMALSQNDASDVDADVWLDVSGAPTEAPPVHRIVRPGFFVS